MAFPEQQLSALQPLPEHQSPSLQQIIGSHAEITALLVAQLGTLSEEFAEHVAKLKQLIPCEATAPGDETIVNVDLSNDVEVEMRIDAAKTAEIVEEDTLARCESKIMADSVPDKWKEAKCPNIENNAPLDGSLISAPSEQETVEFPLPGEVVGLPSLRNAADPEQSNHDVAKSEIKEVEKVPSEFQKLDECGNNGTRRLERGHITKCELRRSENVLVRTCTRAAQTINTVYFQ